MSSQVAAKVSKVEYARIKQLVRLGMYINSSDFVRDAVRRRLAELESSGKADPPKVVKQEVCQYFLDRGGVAWPDEAARDLGYSVLDVLKALMELKEEGKAAEIEEATVVEREA